VYAVKFIWNAIATFGFTGLFPFAPATFATLVFVLIYTYVPGGEVVAHPGVVLATLIVSIPAATQAEKEHGHDAGRIVIDEIVGMQCVLVLAAPTLLGIVTGFVLFRFFDIVKPPPAGKAQNLPRGYGVVADDVIAGVLGRLVLVILAYFFPGFGRFT
jgi:phosphatidylglycerophosphatase A